MILQPKNPTRAKWRRSTPISWTVCDHGMNASDLHNALVASTQADLFRGRDGGYAR